MQSKYAWEFLQIKTASMRYIKDNEWSERTYEDKGMLNFFSKKIYTKTPSNKIEKKGPLFLTIYFLTTVHNEFLQHPAGMKKIPYNVLTPDIFLNHPFLKDE